ncbi:MAG: aminotransferase class I/II-fold pyridoxal phosphate-dependent enzyme [Saprospiraceae bacterium]|nr:aminotransferase class I/II-fold pyridoxal phosphate-dependent enzyme [Saprospiraceae bacterium]
MNSKPFKHLESLCAAEAKIRITTQPHKIPLFASSAFKFESIEDGIEIFKNQPGSHVYTRYGNPTIEAVAQKIANLEVFGSDLAAFGLLTSSGMAAIHLTIQTILKPGDSILTQGNLYGGTTELFNKVFGPQNINIEIIDFGALDNLEQSISNLKVQPVIFIETPTNPTLQCIDILKVCQIVHKYKGLVIVDNTFATPVIQQPILLGADVVIHSTTKFLHGHGVSTGGAIVTSNENLFKAIWETQKLVGSNSNTFDAWLVNIGLKTLVLRMEKQSENALQLAHYLSKHPKINKVHYPGLPNDTNHQLAKRQMKKFGAMLSFEVGSEYQDAIYFANRLNHCALAPSLGETDTMVLHPASMSHLKIPIETRLKYGITDNLIRFSVGIENIEDIIDDIEQALA